MRLSSQGVVVSLEIKVEVGVRFIDSLRQGRNDLPCLNAGLRDRTCMEGSWEGTAGSGNVATNPADGVALGGGTVARIERVRCPVGPSTMCYPVHGTWAWDGGPA